MISDILFITLDWGNDADLPSQELITYIEMY